MIVIPTVIIENTCMVHVIIYNRTGVVKRSIANNRSIGVDSKVDLPLLELIFKHLLHISHSFFGYNY